MDPRNDVERVRAIGAFVRHVAADDIAGAMAWLRRYETTPTPGATAGYLAWDMVGVINRAVSDRQFDELLAMVPREVMSPAARIAAASFRTHARDEAHEAAAHVWNGAGSMDAFDVLVFYATILAASYETGVGPMGQPCTDPDCPFHGEGMQS